MGIGLLGFLFILGSIGFALYEAVLGASSPSDVSVQLEEIISAKNGFLVHFRVINEGGTTTAGLTVEGELRNGDESERSSGNLSLVASSSLGF
jgi:uncharacterized protein (TIGR02588 family)